MWFVRQQEIVQLSLVRKQKLETNTCVKIDNGHLLQNTITRNKLHNRFSYLGKLKSATKERRPEIEEWYVVV